MEYRRSHTNKKELQSQRESGVVFAFLATGLAALSMVAIAFYLSIAETRSTKARIREVVDAAAQKASASYCSTLSCFSNARELALRAIEEELVRSKLAPAGFNLDRAQGPTWTIDDDYIVTVERGYWWPTEPSSVEMPLANLELHANQRFEPIDRPAGVESWQSQNPMRIQHLIANATYIRVERKHLLDTLAYFGTQEMQQAAEVYAVASSVSNEPVCAAPFAVHVCSVVDHNGDYNKHRASEYERFFVGVNRFCPEGDPNCDVIPGALWSPVMDGQRKNRNNGRGSDTFRPDRFAPSGTSPYIHRFACSYEPQLSTRVTEDSIGDQFGVVGLPGAAGSASEKAVLETLLTDGDPDSDFYFPGGCTPTSIGERFDILPEGLTGSVSGAALGLGSDVTADDIIWNQINDSNEDSRHHPEYGETYLDYGVPTFKANSDTGWFYDNIEPDTRSRKCKDFSAPRVGACNSRVMSMYKECILHAYNGALGPDCRNIAQFSGVLDSEFVSACPPLIVDDDGNSSLDPSYYARERVPGVLLAGRYDWQSYFNSNLRGPNPSTPRVTPKAWRIPISVLAPMEASATPGSYASYCQGLGDNTGDDPAFDPGLDYYVIGFVEALFYDTDVGQDSFDPVDLKNVCAADVYDFYEEFGPWGFNGSQNGVANRCNMVKGVISPTTELITGKMNAAEGIAVNSVTLIVP